MLVLCQTNTFQRFGLLAMLCMNDTINLQSSNTMSLLQQMINEASNSMYSIMSEKDSRIGLVHYRRYKCRELTVR